MKSTVELIKQEVKSNITELEIKQRINMAVYHTERELYEKFLDMIDVIEGSQGK